MGIEPFRSAQNIVQKTNEMNPIPGNQGGQVVLPRTYTTVAGDVLAIPVTHGYVAKTMGGDAEPLTLADGEPGQTLVIQKAGGAGTGTLTPTTKTGFVSIAYADTGDTAVLHFFNKTRGWIILSVWGAAGPPAVNLS